jgi:hypothetical protein
MEKRMSNKHKRMFKPWYEDTMLSVWETKTNRRGNKESVKVKHNRASVHDRLGKEWEREQIWNEGY